VTLKLFDKASTAEIKRSISREEMSDQKIRDEK
jgi:hypothetical protein